MSNKIQSCFVFWSILQQVPIHWQNMNFKRKTTQYIRDQELLNHKTWVVSLDYSRWHSNSHGDMIAEYNIVVVVVVDDQISGPSRGEEQHLLQGFPNNHMHIGGADSNLRSGKTPRDDKESSFSRGHILGKAGRYGSFECRAGNTMPLGLSGVVGIYHTLPLSNTLMEGSACRCCKPDWRAARGSTVAAAADIIRAAPDSLRFGDSYRIETEAHGLSMRSLMKCSSVVGGSCRSCCMRVRRLMVWENQWLHNVLPV